VTLQTITEFLLPKKQRILSTSYSYRVVFSLFLSVLKNHIVFETSSKKSAGIYFFYSITILTFKSEGKAYFMFTSCRRIKI